MSTPTAERNTAPPSTGDPDWSLVRQRLTHYLSALDLPQDEQRRLAQQALLEAFPQPDTAQVLPAALKALDALLAEREQNLPAAMPPIRRQSMTPAPIRHTEPARPAPVQRPRVLALSLATLLPRR